ncbi:MAG: tetratricopeptide repeat protein [Treponema sp.]|nr:tetratricopeptide repeat protein [Treponema sp.]
MSRYNENLDYLIQDVDISKEELIEIIVDADKIISEPNSEKEKLIQAYLKKAQCLQKLDKYDESSEVIDKLLVLNPDMPEALVRLGNIYDVNEQHDKAIYCITKAIDLKKDYPYAFCMRGVSYRSKKCYFEAIEDYSKAIEIKPDYAIAYYNRGYAKYKQSDYKEAKKDYTKAIEIKDGYAIAYINRGNANFYLSDYKGAIEDYNKAIEIKLDVANAYFNCGVAYFNSSDFDLAIDNFNKAIENGFNDVSEVYLNRGEVYAKTGKYSEAAKDFNKANIDVLNVFVAFQEDGIGEKIVKIMLDDDEFFKETVESVQKEKIADYKEIYIQSLKIISKLHVKDEIEMPVSHYTRKDTSEIILFDKNCSDKNQERSHFRLNLVNTGNDPEEGKTLFHYLFPQENMSSKIEEFGAFAGCFNFNSDSLNQFRLYGKTEDKEEGTGVSISLNNQFFNEKICIGIEMTPELNTREEESKPNLLPLFRCIYIDPETNKVVSLGQKEEYVFYREKKGKKNDNDVKNTYQEYKNKIKKIQKEISEDLNILKKKTEKSELDRDIIYKLLLNLRYLVKHVAFKEEQECRVVQIRKLDDKKVESDENNRFYVEYLKLDAKNVSEICFAPKAKDIDKFKLQLARNKYKIKCYKSTAPWA